MFRASLTLLSLVSTACSTLDPLTESPFKGDVTVVGTDTTDTGSETDTTTEAKCEFVVTAEDFGTLYEATVPNELLVEVVETGDRENVDPGLTEALRLRLTAVHVGCPNLKVYTGLEIGISGGDDFGWLDEMAFTGMVGISDGETVTYDTGSSFYDNTWYPWMQWVEVAAGESVEISYIVDTTGADSGQIMRSGVQGNGITLLLEDGLLDLANAPMVAESTVTFGSDIR